VVSLEEVGTVGEREREKRKLKRRKEERKEKKDWGREKKLQQEKAKQITVWTE
jgi:hypothetical protein